jgi:hypothetical protein
VSLFRSSSKEEREGERERERGRERERELGVEKNVRRAGGKVRGQEVRRGGITDLS